MNFYSIFYFQISYYNHSKKKIYYLYLINNNFFLEWSLKNKEKNNIRLKWIKIINSKLNELKINESNYKNIFFI